MDRFLLRCVIKIAQSDFNETVGWYGCDPSGLDHEVGCFTGSNKGAEEDRVQVSVLQLDRLFLGLASPLIGQRPVPFRGSENLGDISLALAVPEQVEFQVFLSKLDVR